MDVYGLILLLFFTALFIITIVLLVKVLTELQSLNRNLRSLDRRPTSSVQAAQHRRES